MADRINIPRPRLWMQPVGQRVRLPNDDRIFVIRAVREDRYIDLYATGQLTVTASRCHLCEVMK